MWTWERRPRRGRLGHDCPIGPSPQTLGPASLGARSHSNKVLPSSSPETSHPDRLGHFRWSLSTLRRRCNVIKRAEIQEEWTTETWALGRE